MSLHCQLKRVTANIDLQVINNNITQLKGELKKTFKKYAEIVWTKDDQKWDPKTDGKEKFNGFTIRFHACENF